jgi:hypothetical protein
MRSDIYPTYVFDGVKYRETLCVFLKRLRTVENCIRQSKLLPLTG